MWVLIRYAKVSSKDRPESSHSPHQIWWTRWQYRPAFFFSAAQTARHQQAILLLPDLFKPCMCWAASSQRKAHRNLAPVPWDPYVWALQIWYSVPPPLLHGFSDKIDASYNSSHVSYFYLGQLAGPESPAGRQWMDWDRLSDITEMAEGRYNMGTPV